MVGAGANEREALRCEGDRGPGEDIPRGDGAGVHGHVWSIAVKGRACWWEPPAWARAASTRSRLARSIPVTTSVRSTRRTELASVR